MTEPSGSHSPQTQPGDCAGPNDPARCLWDLWRQGQQPSVDDFLARANICDPDGIVAVLRVDQWERWRLGQRVPAEAYLDAFPAARDQAEHAVELVLAEYLLREELGERPALEEYLGRFPQYAGALELQLELHQALGADREPLADWPERTMTLGDRGEIGSVAGSEGLPVIPGYEVLGVLGRGGMGVVYRAWQKGLNRSVAVKMVHAGAQADPKVLSRFRVEAEAVARLQHPNIVQIHEVGQHAGSPFLVLELVEGRSLAQSLAGTPRPARQAAELVETLARAIHCAHGQGVVHRDLTPANILLTADGRPKITDFGLAKLIKGGSDLRTQTGELLGTPSYMAPEQAASRHQAIGAATDVYALGVILYELLTGRPPFKAESALETLRQVVAHEPVAPSRLRPKLPGDLETICLKCLHKEPSHRYASAAALADDLQCFLENRPIKARRSSVVERYARWARRHPGIAVLGGALTAVLIAATVVSLVVAGRMTALARDERTAKLVAVKAKARAEADRRGADAQRERAEWHLYIARIGQADGALHLSDPVTARILLDKCRPEPGGPDHRGWEWSYLDQWCTPELKTLNVPTGVDANVVAVSPDGRLLAVGCAAPFAAQDGEKPPVPALLIGLPDGEVRHVLGGHKSYVHAVAFRPDDGTRLATLGAEGMIRVWDTGSGRQLSAIPLFAEVGMQPGTDYAGLYWSPDGRRLASACGDDLVRIWDPATGHETVRIACKARSVAWSPDGTRIATGGEAGEGIRIWDAHDGRPHGPDLEQSGHTRSLSWSPDGQRLAAVARDLRVWDAVHRQPVLRVAHVAELRSVAFSPDGTRLATGGIEGIVRVIDAATGRERAALFTGCINVSGLAFHPDGRRVFAAGWGMDGVKVFDPDREPRGRGLVPWLDQLAALTFAPDGRRVLGVECVQGRLAAVDPSDGRVQIEHQLLVTGAQSWPRGDFAFSADGRRLAAPTRRDRSVVGVWDVTLGAPVAALRGSAGPVTAVAFRPDGTALATAAAGGPKGAPKLTLWELGSRRPVRTIEAVPDSVAALAFSGDGRALAAGGGSRTAPTSVTVWEARTGAVVGTLGLLGPVKSLAFHPDGALLAVAEFDQSMIHLWDVTAGTVVTKPGPRAVSCVAFTPDGKRLAALGYDGDVHLADARTGDEVLVLRGFGPPPGSSGFTPRVAFSPDGTRLAANALGHFLNLWELGPPSRPAAEPGPDDLAGWLIRSRALAGLGDDKGATAAFDRALAIRADDPVPWVAHAMAERVDTHQADAALARARAAACDDPVRWHACARALEAAGRKEPAASARARARALAEQRLAQTPDDELAAGVLAGLLKDELSSLRGWTLLEPARMTSDGGAELTRLPDGSILASGPSPDEDTYTVLADTDLVGILGLRLEVLPDPRLPRGGPGREPGSGDFHLTEIGLSLARRGDPAHATPVAFAGAMSQDDAQHAPREAIDHTHATCWNVWPLCGRANALMLRTAAPVGTPGGSTLVVRLDFRAPDVQQRTLGRFRLSVTTQPASYLDAGLRSLVADPSRDGQTRLGVIHYLRGDWPAAAAVLQLAASTPTATGTDRFLLALALHRLGRQHEARRWVDRGVDWLKPYAADEVLRTLAVEAAAEIRGVSRPEAEARLFDDPVFPTDPFAR